MKKASASTPAPAPKSTTKTPTKKRTTPWLVLFLGIALLAILIALGLYTWQHTHGLSRQLSHYQAETNAKQRAIAGELHVMEEALQLSQKQLKRQNTILGKMAFRQTQGKHAWLLPEINHLATLAHYQLTFQQNPAMALIILKTANQQLMNVQDNQYAPLRRVLMQDITALQSLPNRDMEGALLTLQAVNAQVDRLPLKTAQFQQPSTSDKNTPLTAEKGWRQHLQTAWQHIQKLIVIRHHQQPIEPLLSPEQNLYLQQNLHILLWQTQWALIHQQPALYKKTLQAATTLLTQHFHTNAASVQHALTMLTTLEDFPVQAAFPSLDNIARVIAKLQQAQITEPKLQETQPAPKATIPKSKQPFEPAPPQTSSSTTEA